MSYMRPVGDDDVPVTSTTQVVSNDSIIVGGSDVGPKRVPCYQLPSDSPFRQPGQVCAPSTVFMDTLKSIWDGIAGAGVPSVAPTAPTPPAEPSPPWALILGGGAIGAYFIYKNRKKK
jgi:hypothetical protein